MADPVVESFNALQFQRLRVALITALQCKHQQRRNEFHPILSPANFATHFQQQQQTNFCCCCNEREAPKHHCQEKEKKKYPSLAKHQKTSSPSFPAFLLSSTTKTSATHHQQQQKQGEQKIHATPQKKRRDQSHNYSILCRFPTLLLILLLQHTIIPHTLVHYYYLVHALEAKDRKKTRGELHH